MERAQEFSLNAKYRGKIIRTWLVVSAEEVVGVRMSGSKGRGGGVLDRRTRTTSEQIE